MSQLVEMKFLKSFFSGNKKEPQQEQQQQSSHEKSDEGLDINAFDLIKERFEEAPHDTYRVVVKFDDINKLREFLKTDGWAPEDMTIKRMIADGQVKFWKGSEWNISLYEKLKGPGRYLLSFNVPQTARDIRALQPISGLTTPVVTVWRQLLNHKTYIGTYDSRGIGQEFSTKFILQYPRKSHLEAAKNEEDIMTHKSSMSRENEISQREKNAELTDRENKIADRELDQRQEKISKEIKTAVIDIILTSKNESERKKKLADLSKKYPILKNGDVVDGILDEIRDAIGNPLRK